MVDGPPIDLATPTPFRFLGPDHLAVVAVTVLATVLLVRGRHRGAPWVRPAEIALGWSLFAAYPLTLAAGAICGYPMDWGEVLPMHLCNWAGYAGWVALAFRKPLAAELTWFWGMAFTLQGVITPNQAFAFPHPTWFPFFLLHAGVVMAAVHVPFGMGMKPRRRAWLRGIGCTALYLVAAGAVDAALGVNYGFLREKPGQGSLMDAFGPWPYYIAWLIAGGALVITLLDMPFWKGGPGSAGEPRVETNGDP